MSSTTENRVTMTPEAYNGLQKQMDHAMGEVYANRLGEIHGAEPCRSYANSITGARINNTMMFSFCQARMSYSIVRDKFRMSGYGSDHDVSVTTAYASVHADHRQSRKCVWDSNKAYGVDGKHFLLFGELTVEAARKVANCLVDHVRDFVLVANWIENLTCTSRVPPFMTAVAGHVLIHDGDTGATLPETWTGICVDASDTKRFWFIGRSQGERSYSALAAKDMRSAILECQLLIDFEREEAAAGY